jgi:hypothetical protein
MASASSLDPKSIGGIKRLGYLLPLLEPLHWVGCERDSAGNRELHFDEYVTLVLLCMLNPMLESVQMLQQASSLEKISDKLGVKRFNIGSFSESVRVFVELTDARNSGKSDEKNVLGSKLAKDRCYVMDRWYAQFKLFNQINTIESSYVCRMKENSVFEVQEERLLSDEALKAGVVRDAVVKMGNSSKPQDKPDHLMRIVVIEATPHDKRGGRRGKTAGPGNKGTIVIATNLLHVPAEIIALIYQHRWAIEVFFRFFKQILGCRHLVSHKPQGIQIQVYCAIIACMLINLWTGKRPNKATVHMLAWYFAGVASEAEVMAHLNRPDNRGVKLAAKEALWKKLGY